MTIIANWWSWWQHSIIYGDDCNYDDNDDADADLTCLQRPSAENSLLTVTPSSVPESCIITKMIIIKHETLSTMMMTKVTKMTKMTKMTKVTKVTKMTCPRQKTAAPSPTLTAVFGIALTTCHRHHHNRYCQCPHCHHHHHCHNHYHYLPIFAKTLS